LEFEIDPIFGKVATFLNLLILVLIRWPHGNRINKVSVNESRRDGLETALLTGATIGTTLFPLVWLTTGFPSFADYPLHPIAFGSGIVAMVIGNWLFYRAHADLGVYWSPTLQMREFHELITTGIYSRIRHPMYTAMFLQGIGQILFLPNWIVGPAWLITFGILYLFRVDREERMMLERFGTQYEEYMRDTGRLLPLRKQNASE
jgi:protein-S-isoprenylcysteine O-methyltransferase Ste14